MADCEDLCPQRERARRLELGLVHALEQVPGAAPTLLKQYQRPAAGLALQTGEIRSEAAIARALAFLRDSVLPRPAVAFIEVYLFCWDRLRACRHDLVVQRASGPHVAAIYRSLAVFHVWAALRLWNDAQFEAVLNDNQIQQYLMDWGEQRRHVSEDEGAEADVAMLLFCWPEGAAARLRCMADGGGSPVIAWACALSAALQNGNHVRAVRLARSAPSWLLAALAVMRCWDTALRPTALRLLHTACSFSKARYPLADMARLLDLSETDAREMCAAHQLSIEGEVVLLRAGEWREPASALRHSAPPWIMERFQQEYGMHGSGVFCP